MRNLKQILIIFIAFKVTILLASIAYEHIGRIQLLHFEHLATDDIQFNDIYYASKENNKYEEKKVVLINSGSIERDNLFRKNLATLIDKVGKFKTRRIGVDHYFENTTDNDSVLQAAITNNKVVLAYDIKGKYTNRLTSTDIGAVNFPIKNGETVREYYNYFKKNNLKSPSFAAVLSGYNREDSVSYLKYSSDSKGFYDALDINQSISIENFPSIEAVAILNDLVDSEQLKELLNNKIIIIGHLGTGTMDNKFDVEDKFKVPNNNSLFNRELTMPGSLIHANAIQMLLDEDEMFKVEGWIYELITSIILILFLFLFYTIHHQTPLGKLINISIILASTIPIIFISCVFLMNINIYFKIGGLFMQIAFLEEFIDIADGVKIYFTKKN